MSFDNIFHVYYLYYTFLHAESTLSFRHTTIEFVTLLLVLNRGSHYGQVRAAL